MVVIECPECHKLLDSEVVDFEAHCKHHWFVSARNISEIRNDEAQRRYHLIMDALKAESEIETQEEE